MKKIGFLIWSALLLQGCYFANQCGFSQYYYDEKSSFYDSQGVYHEVCPSSNVLNYDDIKARYGAKNPYVYDDLFTPVPSDSPRGQQAMQREFEQWEREQAELAETQGMTGGRNSAYSNGIPNPNNPRVSDWAFGL